MEYDYKIQRKLDLADPDIAENLDLKDSSENLGIVKFLLHETARNNRKSRFRGQKFIADFSAKSSFHCTRFLHLGRGH